MCTWMVVLDMKGRVGKPGLRTEVRGTDSLMPILFAIDILFLGRKILQRIVNEYDREKTE